MEEDRVNHTYLAVTIGPIVKTIKKARSTKELWAASYLISYLMKQIVLQFRKTHTFLSPLAKEDALFMSHNGAGLFPDRLIFKQQDDTDFGKLTSCIEQTVKDLIYGTNVKEGILSEIKDQLKVDYYTTPKGERRTRTWEETGIDTAILNYFQNYLKIYALELTIREGTNIRQLIDQHLTSLELQASLMPPESVDFVAVFFRGIYGRKLSGSLFLEDGFGPKYRRPFPSLFEIATSEFFRSDHRFAYMRKLAFWYTQTQEQTRRIIKYGTESTLPDPDATLLKEVKTLMGSSFKRRHKYIAIIQADGDGMGKVNQAIFEGRSIAEAETLLADVDKRLLTFSLSAINTIDKYGGRPIYLGGDDLLFFAPVMGYLPKAHSNLVVSDLTPETQDAEASGFDADQEEANEHTSVFDLVKRLSTTFDRQFRDDEFFYIENGEKQPIRPRLSFGVSITYYKYPMFEALDKTRHLLEDVAKEVPGKNALAFTVLKNSGQEFGTVYRQQGKVFCKHIATLLRQSPDDDAFLTSVQHTLTNQEELLCLLLEKYKSTQPLPHRMARLRLLVLERRNIKKRLNNFFNNNFNEPVHSQKETFLRTVVDLLSDAYIETQRGQDALKMAYATLRFVQFLHQPDLDDDE